MAVTITDILNQLADAGVFAYVLPFLLVFAVVFGILQKAKIFGSDDNRTKGINAIVAVAVGLLSLQFDFVSTFFAEIFPKLGIAIAGLLVLLILATVFMKDDDDDKKNTFWIIGLVLAGLVILWALSSWNFWGDSFLVGNWFEDHFVAIVVGVLVIVGIGVVMGKKGEGK